MMGNNNWAIAFHGLRTDVKNVVSKIVFGGLIVGAAQACQDHTDCNPKST